MTAQSEEPARKVQADPGYLQEIVATLFVLIAMGVLDFMLFGPERLGQDGTDLVGAGFVGGVAVIGIRILAKGKGTLVASILLAVIVWLVIFHGGRDAPLRPGLGARSLLILTGGTACPSETSHVTPGELCWDLPHVAWTATAAAVALGSIAFFIQVGVARLILRAGKNTAKLSAEIIVGALAVVAPIVGAAISEAVSVAATIVGYVGSVEFGGAVAALLALMRAWFSHELLLALAALIVVAILLLSFFMRRRRRRH